MTISTFETHIRQNRRNSILLVILLVLGTTVLIDLFYVIIKANYTELPVEHADWTTGAMLGAAVGMLAAILSYFQGSFIVLAINEAFRLERYNDPVLFNVVEEISIAAGIPPPKIYAIKDESPNAFATGRDPSSASIAITTGLRKKLNRDELQAVVAHEIAHIKNYDIRLMMLVGVFAGIIVLASDFFVRHFLDTFKMKGFRQRRTSRSPSHSKKLSFTIIAILGAILLSWLAPILAKMLQLAVSREREYLADATAIQLCRNPDALASALRKVAMDPVALRTDNRATEHMFIINPCPKRRLKNSDISSVWSTHPPVISRIRRIRDLAGESGFVVDHRDEQRFETPTTDSGSIEFTLHP